MGHVMRRDDRVPGLHVHLPHTAGQASGMRDEDEDEQGKKQPPSPPRCVADLQVMAFFSFIPLSLKKRLDGADCFRHQTSYSRSVIAVAFSAASYVDSFLDAFRVRRKEHTLCAFPASTLFFSL